MKFLVPSYKRSATAKTPNTLVELGVPKSDIYLGVQTFDDLAAYSEVFPEINVVYGEAHNAAGNRNNLLKLAAGERVVLMDDDVGDVVYIYDESKTFVSRVETAIQTRNIDASKTKA